MKGIFPPKWETVSYSSKPVPSLAVKSKPEEPRDRARDVMVIKEDSPRPVLVAIQTMIPTRPERIALVATDARVLVQ